MLPQTSEDQNHLTLTIWKLRDLCSLIYGFPVAFLTIERQPRFLKVDLWFYLTVRPWFGYGRCVRVPSAANSIRSICGNTNSLAS